MSDSFMLATRIPMTREGFERWLDTPAPDPGAIANPGDMFDGWFWNGRRADTEWGSAEVGVTPRDFFGGLVVRACSGASSVGVLLHREDALEAYLFHLGYAESTVHTALLMFAAAGAFKSEPAEDTVLFWAEAGGSLRDARWDGWLAVLSVGKDGARFTGTVDLADPIAGLRSVEDRFFAMVDRLAEEEESWDSDSGAPYRTDTPRDPAFTDPAVLERR
ncbi:hypothetical protein [Rhizohabitans arisaemae]|uniref:hypothetical protein n=1 Tax=Rhizohabitans arisaemae TaxID=2720610 RepID=UPI0024B0A837|nr:hypothetical protein [Rhizohabitans arisaemae]